MTQSITYQMNPEEIHSTLLCILEAIINLCENEQIEYFLIGGGCLGIVRHDNNLIPWDDDLDISIWAGDMPRFLFAMKKLPAPFRYVIKNQSLNPTVKIIDATTQIMFNDPAKGFDSNNDGVFIDVVPMMHWRSRKWKRLDDLYALVISINQSIASPTRWKRIFKKTLKYTGCIHILHLLGRKIFEPLILKMDKHCRDQKFGYISGAAGRSWIVRCPREVIYPLQKVRLGNLFVMAPNNLCEYVRCRYGEHYMEIPDATILWKHFDRALRITS